MFRMGKVKNFHTSIQLLTFLKISCKFSIDSLTLKRLTLAEMGLISATTWGFGFLQYCFEKENVFYNEFCKNDTKEFISQTKTNYTGKSMLVTKVGDKIYCQQHSVINK